MTSHTDYLPDVLVARGLGAETLSSVQGAFGRIGFKRNTVQRRIAIESANGIVGFG